MTSKSNHISMRAAVALILITLATLLLGVTEARAFDILENEFTDGGERYRIFFESSDLIYTLDILYCDGETFAIDLDFSTDNIGVNAVKPMFSVTTVWENHGTITAYSGACGGEVAPGGTLLCSQVAVAERFERYSLQEISFVGNRNVASAGMYIPGVDGRVEIGGLSYDWSTRTWSGTFSGAPIPAGEYRGVYMAVYNADGEQFKCLVGKFVVE